MPVSRQEIESMMRHVRTAREQGRCDQCGYDWSIGHEDARAVINGSPRRCRELLADRWEEARKSPDEQTWSPSAYVWHMADAIGIWAERLEALAEDPASPIVGFDQDDLAAVRGYARLSPIAGLWALERRIDDWNAALQAHSLDRSFVHPDFGELTVGELVRWVAHDQFHHQWDIQRLIERS